MKLPNLQGHSAREKWLRDNGITVDTGDPVLDEFKGETWIARRQRQRFEADLDAALAKGDREAAQRLIDQQAADLGGPVTIPAAKARQLAGYRTVRVDQHP